jgi:hypothetical protein
VAPAEESDAPQSEHAAVDNRAAMFLGALAAALGALALWQWLVRKRAVRRNT